MNTRNEEEVSTQPSLETDAELFMGNLLLLFDPASPFALVVCTLNLFREKPVETAPFDEDCACNVD